MNEPEPSPREASEPSAQAERDAAGRATAPNDPVFEPTEDALFEALWAKVMGAWEDDKAHGAALEYAVRGEKLPDLAGRYRLLKDDPVRGERAKKRLDAIVIAATQLMMSMRTQAKATVPLPITLSVAGLFLCAVAFVAYVLFHRQ